MIGELVCLLMAYILSRIISRDYIGREHLVNLLAALFPCGILLKIEK